jgi:serine protease Do
VTNHHVAGDAEVAFGHLSNREQVDAKLVGTDALSDLAVIKLEPLPEGQSYPTAQWGDSSTLNVGETVLAMGSPFAFSQSSRPDCLEYRTGDARLGRLHTRWRGRRLDSCAGSGMMRRFIPANSGGPLVNLRGEIIGINEI